MPKKPVVSEPVKSRFLLNRDAYNHLSKEERFLLFVVPALGTSRAAKCFVLDEEKADAVWAEFSRDPTPVNLKNHEP